MKTTKTTKTTKALNVIEAKTGVIPPRIIKLEDIAGAEMEKRALEVALAGGHSLAILYNEGSHAPQLIQTAVRIAQEIGVPFHGLAHPWCGCGNYGSPKVECRCSPRAIEAHLSKLAKRVGSFAIWIGASMPLARYMHIKGEPETDFMARVIKAKASPAPSADLDAFCQDLIAAYVNTMSGRLSLPTLTTVKAIAQTIARMEGADKIQTQHLAEALQYQPHAVGGFREFIRPEQVEVKA